MFKKLKELLEAGKIDENIAKELDSEISVALKEVRDEDASYRVKLKEVEDSYKKQLEEKTKELEEKIEEAKKAGELEVAKQFEEKLKALENEKSELEAKTKQALLDSAINKVLAETKVVDADLARLYLKEHISLEDDKPIVKVGDEVLNLENGVKKLFEAKPNLLAAAGNGGSGASNGGGSYVGKRKSEMSPTEKAQFIKEKGQEAYLKLED